MPRSAVCPCLGTSSPSPCSPLSPLRDRAGNQDGAAQISREAAAASQPRAVCEGGSGCWHPEVAPVLHTHRIPIIPPQGGDFPKFLGGLQVGRVAAMFSHLAVQSQSPFASLHWDPDPQHCAAWGRS